MFSVLQSLGICELCVITQLWLVSTAHCSLRTLLKLAGRYGISQWHVFVLLKTAEILAVLPSSFV